MYIVILKLMFYFGALLSISSTPPFKIHPTAMLRLTPLRNDCLITFKTGVHETEKHKSC